MPSVKGEGGAVRRHYGGLAGAALDASSCMRDVSDARRRRNASRHPFSPLEDDTGFGAFRAIPREGGREGGREREREREESRVPERPGLSVTLCFGRQLFIPRILRNHHSPVTDGWSIERI
jgi:hypothetical protein